ETEAPANRLRRVGFPFELRGSILRLAGFSHCSPPPRPGRTSPLSRTSPERRRVCPQSPCLRRGVKTRLGSLRGASRVRGACRGSSLRSLFVPKSDRRAQSVSREFHPTTC